MFIVNKNKTTNAPSFTKISLLKVLHILTYLIYYILWLCCCCGCRCKVSAIDQISSFRTHSECNVQTFEGIDVFFLFLLFKGLMAYGILNNFLSVMRIIES